MKELLASLWPELPSLRSVSWTIEKEKLGIYVVRAGYNAGCIETIFTTKDPEKRKKGWIIKNGTNSIYFINMRNAGILLSLQPCQVMRWEEH